MAGSIKIQRGETTVSADGDTTSLGAAVGSLSSAFLVITNNRHVGAGDPTSESNHEGDDMSVSGYLSDTSTITWNRPTTLPTLDTKVAWEVWEYIGAVGAANEFIVRDRAELVYTSATSATKSLTSAGISSYDDCIPFLNGANTSDTGDGGNGMHISAWINTSGTLTVECGENDSAVKSTRVVTVEFTGSAWSVGHGRTLASTADNGSFTLNTSTDGSSGSTFNVTSWSQAIIASWGHKGDGTNQAIADGWPRLEPGSGTSTVAWDFDSQHDGTDDDIWAHVLDHADLSVTRYSDTVSAPAANVNVTSAGLTDLTQSSVLGTVTSSGTGTGYGRGWRNYRLTSLTNVEHWCHRSGNTMSHNIQVIDWTGVEESAPTQNINLTPIFSGSLPTALSLVSPGEVSRTLTPIPSSSSITALSVSPGQVSRTFTPIPSGHSITTLSGVGAPPPPAQNINLTPISSGSSTTAVDSVTPGAVDITLTPIASGHSLTAIEVKPAAQSITLTSIPAGNVVTSLSNVSVPLVIALQPIVNGASATQLNWVRHVLVPTHPVNKVKVPVIDTGARRRYQRPW